MNAHFAASCHSSKLLIDFESLNNLHAKTSEHLHFNDNDEDEYIHVSV